MPDDTGPFGFRGVHDALPRRLRWEIVMCNADPAMRMLLHLERRVFLHRLGRGASCITNLEGKCVECGLTWKTQRLPAAPKVPLETTYDFNLE